MFVLEADPANALLHIRVSGFWDAETLDAYMAAMRATFGRMMAAGGCRRVLVDMSDYPIQAREIADAHGRALLYARERHGIRAAVVMTSALSKLQASRVAADAGHRVFTDAAAAREWLLAD